MGISIDISYVLLGTKHRMYCLEQSMGFTMPIETKHGHFGCIAMNKAWSFHCLMQLIAI